jgi:SNF2 family DNA or RNA helicase
LDALLKLRQVCCDPRLLSLPEATIAHGHSAKLDALLVLLDSLVSEGRRVLVFSQFTSMLALIEAVLKKRQYPYFLLTGQTKQRQALVDRFQAGEVPIFLISLKAGGVGLNLTRADTVVLYDPWWNPAVHDQAASRSHRIGQDNPVFIYQFIAQGTVEEVMLDMQSKKRDLFNSVFDNQATHAFGLTESDLNRFFAKIE